MVTIAKIKCFECKGKFDFYFNTRMGTTIQCPYCFTYMDEHSTTCALNAMAELSDFNREMRKNRDPNAIYPCFQMDLIELGK